MILRVARANLRIDRVYCFSTTSPSSLSVLNYSLENNRVTLSNVRTDPFLDQTTLNDRVVGVET